MSFFSSGDRPKRYSSACCGFCICLLCFYLFFAESSCWKLEKVKGIKIICFLECSGKQVKQESVELSK